MNISGEMRTDNRVVIEAVINCVITDNVTTSYGTEAVNLRVKEGDGCLRLG